MQPPSGESGPSLFIEGRTDQPLLPTEIERSTLLDLIALSKSRLAEEDKISVASEDPMGDLYALIKTRGDYDIRLNQLPGRQAGISPAAKIHLIRMIVVHSKEMSKELMPQGESLETGLRISFSQEYREYEEIKQQGGELPEEWRAAYEDAASLQSPEREVE